MTHAGTHAGTARERGTYCVYINRNLAAKLLILIPNLTLPDCWMGKLPSEATKEKAGISASGNINH